MTSIMSVVLECGNHSCKIWEDGNFGYLGHITVLDLDMAIIISMLSQMLIRVHTKQLKQDIFKPDPGQSAISNLKITNLFI